MRIPCLGFRCAYKDRLNLCYLVSALWRARKCVLARGGIPRGFVLTVLKSSYIRRLLINGRTSQYMRIHGTAATRELILIGNIAHFRRIPLSFMACFLESLLLFGLLFRLKGSQLRLFNNRVDLLGGHSAHFH